jgi:hypothetical protein
MKRRQILELCSLVLLRRRCLWGRCLLRGLLRVLLVIPRGLATLHAAGHGGCGSRNYGRAGCHT